jgi:hypothetical protein
MRAEALCGAECARGSSWQQPTAAVVLLGGKSLCWLCTAGCVLLAVYCWLCTAGCVLLCWLCTAGCVLLAVYCCAHLAYIWVGGSSDGAPDVLLAGRGNSSERRAISQGIASRGCKAASAATAVCCCKVEGSALLLCRCLCGCWLRGGRAAR